MKSMEEYVPARLFILQFKVVLTYILARKWNLVKLLSILSCAVIYLILIAVKCGFFAFFLSPLDCERVKIILFMVEVR